MLISCIWTPHNPFSFFILPPFFPPLNITVAWSWLRLPALWSLSTYHFWTYLSFHQTLCYASFNQTLCCLLDVPPGRPYEFLGAKLCLAVPGTPWHAQSFWINRFLKKSHLWPLLQSHALGIFSHFTCSPFGFLGVSCVRHAQSSLHLVSWGSISETTGTL